MGTVAEWQGVVKVVMGSVPSLDGECEAAAPTFSSRFQVVVSEASVWSHRGPHPVTHAQLLGLELLFQCLVVQTI